MLTIKQKKPLEECSRIPVREMSVILYYVTSVRWEISVHRPAINMAVVALIGGVLCVSYDFPWAWEMTQFTG